MRKESLVSVALMLLCMVIVCNSARAQVSSFGYQGKLDDAGVPANGQYDFTFKLYQVPTGGTQVGSDWVRENVQVTNGIFNTFLGFGTTPFTTMPLLYVEVLVRPGASTGAYTPLSPRTVIQTVPYSLKSFASDIATHASFLDGIASSGFVGAGDPRLTDARNPLPNSPNYIQNGTAQQATSNFNISGNGVIGGGLQVSNGISASSLGLTGNMLISNGGSILVDTGPRDGRFNESLMVFTDVGQSNVSTGLTTEATNQVINLGANSGREGPFLSTRDGYLLRFDTRPATNGIRFYKKAAGSGNEIEMVTIDTLGNMGIGAPAPGAKLHVSSAGIVRARVNSNINAGLALTLNDQPGWSLATVTGGQFQIFNDSIGANAVWIDRTSNNVGIGTSTPAAKLDVAGTVRVGTIGISGSTAVCFNASLILSSCSSSARYKTNVDNFSYGLDVIRRLRPVSFNWRDGGMRDLGLVAEEVAAVEPQLTTKNSKGETEGVKYDRVGVVLVNAVKEQQLEIDSLKKQVAALKALLCAGNAAADVCKEEE